MSDCLFPTVLYKWNQQHELFKTEKFYISGVQTASCWTFGIIILWKCIAHINDMPCSAHTIELFLFFFFFHWAILRPFYLPHMHACCRFNHVFVTPWTIAHQAPLSMGFSREEYWSGVPCPPPRDLPDPGMEEGPWLLLHWQAGCLPPAQMGKPILPPTAPKFHHSCFY